MLNMFERCVGRPPVRPKLDRETERLLALGALQAADMARILQFRAKAGLLNEEAPGFWANVAHNIGHTIGLPDNTELGTNLLVL